METKGYFSYLPQQLHATYEQKRNYILSRLGVMIVKYRKSLKEDAEDSLDQYDRKEALWELKFLKRTKATPDKIQESMRKLFFEDSGCYRSYVVSTNRKLIVMFWLRKTLDNYCDIFAKDGTLDKIFSHRMASDIVCQYCKEVLAYAGKNISIEFPFVTEHPYVVIRNPFLPVNYTIPDTTDCQSVRRYIDQFDTYTRVIQDLINESTREEHYQEKIPEDLSFDDGTKITINDTSYRLYTLDDCHVVAYFNQKSENGYSVIEIPPCYIVPAGFSAWENLISARFCDVEAMYNSAHPYTNKILYVCFVIDKNDRFKGIVTYDSSSKEYMFIEVNGYVNCVEGFKRHERTIRLLRKIGSQLISENFFSNFS